MLNRVNFRNFADMKRNQGYKPTKRYRLTFISENTLNTLWTLRLSRLKAWLLGGLCVAAIGALIALLFGLTPLGSILPGYMKPSERRSQITNALRIDSLAERQQVIDQWVENLEAILTDSIAPAAISEISETVTDTLLAASEAERRFVSDWTERERFNLTQTTPAAASGINFRLPLATELHRDTLSGPSLQIESTRQATVMSIQGGTVVDAHVDIASGRHVILVQHPMDFVSRYEGLARSFVTTGQPIQPGAALGLLGDDARLRLTIYRAGMPLLP